MFLFKETETLGNIPPPKPAETRKIEPKHMPPRRINNVIRQDSTNSNRLLESGKPSSSTSTTSDSSNNPKSPLPSPKPTPKTTQLNTYPPKPTAQIPQKANPTNTAKHKSVPINTPAQNKLKPPTAVLRPRSSSTNAAKPVSGARRASKCSDSRRRSIEKQDASKGWFMGWFKGDSKAAKTPGKPNAIRRASSEAKPTTQKPNPVQMRSQNKSSSNLPATSKLNPTSSKPTPAQTNPTTPTPTSNKTAKTPISNKPVPTPALNKPVPTVPVICKSSFTVKIPSQPTSNNETATSPIATMSGSLENPIKRVNSRPESVMKKEVNSRWTISGTISVRQWMWWTDYFTGLEEQLLHIFKYPSDAEPTWMLDLFGAVVEVVEANVFSLKGPHFQGTWKLRAPDSTSREDWIKALQNAINSAKPRISLINPEASVHLDQKPPERSAVVPSKAEISSNSPSPIESPRLPQDTVDLSGWKQGALLGQGAFGSVHLALLRTGMFVAVKIVPCGSGADKQTIEELRKEIDVMANLNHSNIVRYFGSSVNNANNDLHIFIEYMPQGSISHIIKGFGPLALQTLRVYLMQMLNGLGYLHNMQIVHRDIKCDNVLIDKDGTAKLADFGCAKQYDKLVQKQCATLVGTPYFMAPEVVCSESYNYKADVWSVGCTVIEMTTGKHPWPDSASPWSVLYQITNSTGPPTGIPDDIDPKLLHLLECCFIRDPEKRASVQDLINEPFMK